MEDHKRRIMNTRSPLVLVLFVTAIGTVLAASCASRRSEPIKGELFMAADERIAKGERVYMLHCQKCHPGGEAGLGPAINSNPAPKFVKRFQVRHGLGTMPSFKKDEISSDELKALSNYLHAWKSY